MKRLALLLLLAPGLHAQHEYIIPIVASVSGVDADHYAVAEVLNPTSRTAHLRVTGVYSLNPGLQCQPAVPAELAPRSRGEFICRSGALAAITIESDEPLVVKNTITSFLRRPDCAIVDVQQIDAPAGWIPFASEAV